jgi:hypothetical protein
MIQWGMLAWYGGDMTVNRYFLRIEGSAVFLLILFFYQEYQFSWLTFALLLLFPDISMLGYLRSASAGALVYNFFHTYSVPIFLIILALILQFDPLLMIAFIWIAHIGMDRMLGYGLKYPSAFKDTHLHRI